MKKNNVKFLFAGRTAAGKDYLETLLKQSYGWTFVNSYSTRDKRFPEENTHEFITHEEAKKFSDDDKVAKTIINGEEYFATRQQVENADAYIIDPNGIEVLLEKMPTTWFEIIYITADEEQRKEKAIGRADDREKAAEIFDSRNADEDEQFSLFEEQIKNDTFEHNNHFGVHVVTNTYDSDFMEEIAISIEMRKRFYNNCKDVMDVLARKKLINYAIIDDIECTTITHESGEPVNVPINKMVQLLAEEKRTTLFSELMESFLFSVKDLSHLEIANPIISEKTEDAE